MITKIKKIKNLGIFTDYKWDSSLLEFKRFNLIYGWNGSGKTTLSQLFASFETGKSEIYPELEYEIQTAGGNFTQKNIFNKKIRVFNREYISENIEILSGKAKPIFILGKENKELADAIKQDEKILYGDQDKKGDIGKIKELDQKKKELDRKEKEKGKNFTNVAKIISTNTSGVSARNYRKNNAEQAFSKLKAKQILSEEDINKFSLTLKQRERSILNELSIGDINENVNIIILKAKSLLHSTVETAMIERLKENPDISKWVEQGLTLHTKNSSNCEFCNQPLPSKRILELLSYFNDADKKLKGDIDILIDGIEKLYATIRNLNFLDKANLYDELQNDYSFKVEIFTKSKTELLENISTFREEIEKKKTNTATSLELFTNICTESFISAVNKVNDEILKHNEKTNNFTQAKEEATTKLENHYLSEIFDDIKYLEVEINKLDNEISYLEKGNPEDSINIGINQIQKRIIERKNKISNSGPACDKINEYLMTFLGRDELTFEIADEGYIIKRKDKIAKNLSEGEKTAIAFVYFTIHLKDQDFDLKDGIVVIDDPISSLDANSLFQAFAFLKNAVKESAQVFILTHNFDFLKLLLNWLKNYPKHDGGKEYYMIKNQYVENNRIATLDAMDELLKNYESEYQYLFKTIYNFKSDGTIESVYHIPNLARKLLEYFLMIMVPNSISFYQKIESLDFDENKKTAIYKFMNDRSHITGKGFDPSLVQESQNNVKYLMEMMETVFPEHYNILKNLVSGCSQS